MWWEGGGGCWRYSSFNGFCVARFIQRPPPGTKNSSRPREHTTEVAWVHELLRVPNPYDSWNILVAKSADSNYESQQNQAWCSTATIASGFWLHGPLHGRLLLQGAAVQLYLIQIQHTVINHTHTHTPYTIHHTSIHHTQHTASSHTIHDALYIIHYTLYIIHHTLIHHKP